MRAAAMAMKSITGGSQRQIWKSKGGQALVIKPKPTLNMFQHVKHTLCVCLFAGVLCLNLVNVYSSLVYFRCAYLYAFLISLFN